MSKITYLDDIVKELAEEFDVDEKQIAEICKLNIGYIHKLTKTPGVISIQLPNLGVLHFNASRARYSYKHSNAFRKYIDVVATQISKVDAIKKNCKDLVHGRKSFYTIIRKYFIKDKDERRRTGKAEVYRLQEIKQNKVMK